MRVYVAAPKENNLNLEGLRYSKVVKECLKVTEHHVNSNKTDQSNLLFHLFTLDDELKAAEAKGRKLPVIVNALYCESDPTFSILQTETNIVRWVHLCNESTMVLVPCEEAKNILVNCGVTTDISIWKPPVVLERYRSGREKDVFYHYFMEDEGRDLIVGCGDLSTMDGVRVFLNIAEKYPDKLFYYFDISRTQDSGAISKKIAQYNTKNVKFVSGVPDDVFISALINATLFVAPSYCPLSCLTLANVLASSTQIIMRSQANTTGYLKNKVNAYLGEYSETIEQLCCDYLNGKLSPTIKQGYSMVQDTSFAHCGHNLDHLYLEAKNLSSYEGVW